MFDLKKPHDIALIVLLISVPVLGFGCYLLSQEQNAIAETLAKMEEAQTKQQLATQIDVPEVSEIVERQVFKQAASWRDIQDRIADTVVQVFAHVAEINMLMPFQTPQQYSACGSGFFISPDGYLVSNAHVINQARAVWIQIPALGRRIIDVEVVGMT